MSTEIKVPALPESVADATIVAWHKSPGDSVSQDENLVDLETDKVVLEVPAPADGVLKEIVKQAGDVVTADEILGLFEAGAVAASAPVADATGGESSESASSDDTDLSPAVRRLVAEHGVDASKLNGSGKGGRIVKQDVLDYVAGQSKPSQAKPAAAAPVMDLPVGDRTEKRVPMSRLRARIAERLLDAQHNAAMLTTFNEVNLQAVMDLRAQYKDQFEKAHGIKLGFMSFFTKAAVEALKRYPAVNASIDGNDILYHGYYDIGVAVSTERGLVVPVIRNAEHLSFADIEKTITSYGAKARDGQLSIDEMTGGTFTISNGGIFGSLLSTPILNPPQSAILGMHKIEQRPVVENGEIVIRPMMYLAMSYDHRIIDGKESVTFLAAIKAYLEDPARLLLDI